MSVVINRFHGSSYSSGGIPAFNYTGTYETTVDGKKWEIVLKDSGTFSHSKSIKCDIFLQAGGNGGNWSSDTQWYGGAGGSGGNYLTMTEITLAAGNHTVTVGGSGSASVFGTYTTANGSSGSAGGRRAMGDFDGYSYSIIQSSTAGSAGRLAFTGATITDCITPSLHGFKFGAGGGGGGISVGSATDSGSSGGTNGGGSGGTSDKNGAANSGSGGGGAYGGSYSPGSGGSGIIIIRGGF